MFQCKSCGASMLFDIAAQKMLCPYCNTTCDPYDMPDTGEAQEMKDMEVTIYVCPQCGGELGATETSAAEFCSFCGAPVILESRMSRMEKPKYIIPFQKTKEESIKAFRKHLKMALFTPRDFKDCELESFRGIYMPAWSYNVTQKNNKAELNIQAVNLDGDGHNKFTMSAKVEARYEGVSHDASAQFADSISECLEPYDYKKRKDFVPSFIAGFFSDIKDVESSRYEAEAITLANTETYRQYQQKIPVTEVVTEHLIEDEEKTRMFNTKVESIDSTLLPVWFMSYRKGKRICYATVNGETGKVVSDLPISMGKLLLAALALAIPLFFFFNMLISMRASTLVVLSLAMIALTGLLYCSQLGRIEKRESDILYQKAERRKFKDKVQRKKKKADDKLTFLEIIAVAVFSVIHYFWILIIGVMVGGAVIYGIYENRLILTYYVASFGAVIVSVYGIFRYRKKKLHMHPFGFLSLLAAGLICIAVYYQDPVSDIYFYGAAIAALTAILFALVNLCRTINMLTTRPLPQLQRRGGDEHAK